MKAMQDEGPTRRRGGMGGRTKAALLVLAAALIGGGLVVHSMLNYGFSARDQPTAVEAFVARRLRRLAVSRDSHAMKNPVPLTPQVMSEARAHFADHCALCHGNDGRGRTQIGRNLYPKAPDMQGPETQDLSDGEIFHVIRNGVRLTGMPAWGGDTPEDDMESWKLVHLIRNLANITPEEMEEMRSLNPMSRREFEEEQKIERFLEGGESPSTSPQHKH